MHHLHLQSETRRPKKVSTICSSSFRHQWSRRQEYLNPLCQLHSLHMEQHCICRLNHLYLFAALLRYTYFIFIPQLSNKLEFHSWSNTAKFTIPWLPSAIPKILRWSAVQIIWVLLKAHHQMCSAHRLHLKIKSTNSLCTQLFTEEQQTN